jgi:hypothetical protein
LVYPKILTKYGRKPTTLQTFLLIGNAIGVEMQGKIALTMATNTYRFKSIELSFFRSFFGDYLLTS